MSYLKYFLIGVALTFCLWQIEICVIFRAVGWEIDILFIKLPNWFVVTFYSMVIVLLFALTILLNRQKT